MQSCFHDPFLARGSCSNICITECLGIWIAIPKPMPHLPKLALRPTSPENVKLLPFFYCFQGLSQCPRCPGIGLWLSELEPMGVVSPCGLWEKQAGPGLLASLSPGAGQRGGSAEAALPPTSNTLLSGLLLAGGGFLKQLCGPCCSPRARLPPLVYLESVHLHPHPWLANSKYMQPQCGDLPLRSHSSHTVREGQSPGSNPASPFVC